MKRYVQKIMDLPIFRGRVVVLQVASEADAEIRRLREALEWVVAQYAEWGDIEPVHVEACKRALNSEPTDTGGVCEWRADDDPDVWGDSGLWESTCGVAYQFTNGGPEENNHKFCHVCGKPIRLSKTEEVSSE